MRNLLYRQVNLFTRRVYSTNLGSEIANAKSFSEMPTISFLKMVKESLPGGKYYKKSLKEVIQAFNEEFGEAVRIPAMLGNPEVVMSYNSEYFERIFRVEGPWPVRTGLDSLEYYRDTKRPEIYKDLGSLFVSHGEKWSNMRSIANPILMQPKTIKKYTTQVDDIAKEFIEVMRKIRNEKSEMPGDFSNYINTWSLESVAAVGLERRLNLFDENTNDENAKKLIIGIRNFFELTAEYDGKASIWKYYQTKGFKELLKTYDTLTDVILHYVESAMKEMEEENLSSKESEDSILRKLLRADKRVAVIVVCDLLMAGVDTTASAVLNTLYCLAKNPDKQEILRQELIKILPEKKSKMTSENNKNMPYLRAVIKEGMRMFPVAAGNVRQTTKEIVVSGYRVPANTHVAIQFYDGLMNEKYYPEPNKFLPERWLRDQTENSRAGVANPFSFLPFGFGVRSCVGKRIAELEIETLVSNVIRNFKVEWHYPDMKIKSTFVNIPDSEMRFKLIDV